MFRSHLIRWMNGSIAIIILSVLIFGLPLLADDSALSARMPEPAARQPAPSFRLNDVDGKPFDLAAHLGREVILVDFWATYCAPCQVELKAFEAIHKREHPQGFEVVAISIDQPQSAARVRAFAHARAFPFPVLADPGQDAYRLYAVSALPTSVLIDRQGRIAYRREGFEPGDEAALEARIDSLLAPAQAAPASAEASHPTGNPQVVATQGNLHDTGHPQDTLRAGTSQPSSVIGSSVSSSAADSPGPSPVGAQPQAPAPPSANASRAPIEPAAPAPIAKPWLGSLSGLSLSGSNFLRGNYGREDRALPDPNGWLEDWFDVRLADGNLSYQMRFRDYQFLRQLPGTGDNLIRDPTERVVKQTFAYAGSHADIRAGNVYGTVGRGLIFRFFEDRTARIDRDMNGAWGALEGGEADNGLGYGRVSVFGGKTFSKFPDIHTVDAEEPSFRDLYLQGGEAAWNPKPWLKTGAQYLEAFKEGWNARLAGGNAEIIRGPTAVYLGYVGVTGEDKFNYPHTFDGRALYGSLSENFGNLEAGAEYKYYHNYDLGFTDPPNLVLFHTFRLMARDMLFSNNQAEEGLQVHGAWHFQNEASYAANVSTIESHPERNPTLLIEHESLPFIDVDQELRLPWTGRGTVLLDADWNNQRKFSEGEFQDIRAYSFGLSGEKPAGYWVFGSEAELQYRDTDFRDLLPGDALSGKLGSAGGVNSPESAWQGVLSGTVGRASAWSFTLDYEATTSSREKDPNAFDYRLGGITNGWSSAYLTLSMIEGQQISLWMGQRKERVVCAGGSCRLEPAFEGTELIWTSHF